MNLIRVEHFAKRFGEKVVHSDVNLVLQKGECLGLIGGSGTGKSVLLRSLIGLEKPDSGEIYFKDQEITEMAESDLIEIRKQIAYVFQGGALFDSMTVFENLAYPLRAHTQLNEDEIDTRIQALLKEFGLQGNDALFPGALSGGMQKRVGLARAIIMEPDVILYDEPTAGLDPFNTRRIQDMILRMKAKGKSSVLVTHDMPVAMAVCDRIAILGKGQISSIETVPQIHEDSEGLIAKFIQGEVS